MLVSLSGGTLFAGIWQQFVFTWMVDYILLSFLPLLSDMLLEKETIDIKRFFD